MDNLFTDQGHSALSRLSPIWLWAVAAGAAFLLFGATTAPDVLMISDSGQYQVWAYLFPDLPLLPRPPALVRLHLPYYFFGKLFGLIPFGTYAWRINLLSAFCGALTVGNVVVLTAKLSASKWAPLFAGVVVCFGHTLWAFSVAAEVVTMMTACITFELLLWSRYESNRNAKILLLIALLNGFGTAIHHQIGLNGIVYALAVLVFVKQKKISPVYLIAWPAAWCLGSLPDLVVMIYYMVKTQDVSFILRSYAVGVFGDEMATVSLTTLRDGVAALALNYPTGLVLLVPAGVMALLRIDQHKTLGRVFLAILAVQFFFPMTYAVADQYSFFVPFYALAGVMIALGAAQWLKRRELRLALFALAVMPVGVYLAAPRVLLMLDVPQVSRPAPYYDPNSFLLRPWKYHSFGQRRYLEEVFEQLPPRTAFLSGEKIAYILSYGQIVEKRRTDLRLRISPPLLAGLLDWEDPDQPARWRQPVYTPSALLAPDRLHIREHCELIQEGIVSKVMPPRDPGAWLRDVQVEIDRIKSRM